MFKTDILFNGYYGQKNTGDDSFVEVATWGAAKYWMENNSRFLAREKDLPLTRKRARGYPFLIPKTYRIQEKLLINNAKSIVSVGGSTFHNISPGSIKNKILKLKKSRKNLINIGAIGVSLGPFLNKENEKNVIDYLTNIDFLSTRDSTSYYYAKSLNLPYEPTNAFDLAALLPKIYGSEIKGESGDAEKVQTIGVSICNFESYINNGNIKNELRRNIFFQDLLNLINKEGRFKFKFFIFNGHPLKGDLELTLNTIQKLNWVGNYEIIPYNQQTEKTWNEMKLCDIFLATRLHAGIFACFLHLPFFLIEYHEKCTNFLNDIGQSDIYRVFDGNTDLNTTADKVLSILNGQEYFPPKNLHKMEERALLNFTSNQGYKCFL